jgi:hypothetical protein
VCPKTGYLPLIALKCLDMLIPDFHYAILEGGSVWYISTIQVLMQHQENELKMWGFNNIDALEINTKSVSMFFKL